MWRRRRRRRQSRQKVETKKVEPPKEVKKAPEKEVKAPAAEPAAQEVKKKPAKEAKIAATPPVSSRRPASATSTPPVSSRAKDASSGIVSIRHSGAPRVRAARRALRPDPCAAAALEAALR